MKSRSALTQRTLCRALAAVFPVAGVMAWAPPAAAACTTAGSVVTCEGTVPAGFSAVGTGLTVNILEDAVLQANTAVNPSVAAQINASSFLNNLGNVQNAGGSQTNNYGVSLNGSDTVFTNDGTVTTSINAGDITTTAAKNTRSLFSVISSATSGSFSNVNLVNNGSIIVEHAGAGNARGIYAGEALGGEDVPGLIIENHGIISVARGPITVTVSGGALQGRFSPTVSGALGIAAGIDSDDDAENLTVINHAGGVIEASGPYASAIYGRAGEVSIENAGTIRNVNGGIAIAAHGAGDDEPGEIEISNAAGGVIQGDIVIVDGNALRYWAAQNGVTGLTLNNQAGVRVGEIENAGTITGNIYLGSGEHSVTNTGEITGSIFVDQNGIGTAIGEREFTLTNLGILTGNITIKDTAGATNTITLAGGGFSGDITATTGAGTNSLILQGSGVLHNVSKFSTLEVGGEATGGGEGGDDDDDDDGGQPANPTGPGTWTLAPGTTQQFSAGAEVKAGSALIVESTLQADVLVDAGATLGGTGLIQGNVINNGTIQLAAAKLSVSGAVNLGAGSVLKTTLTGPGGGSPNAPSDNAGQLVVGATGTADPSAKIAPVASGTVVRNGDWYRIGHNSSGGTVFSSLPGVESSALLSWDIQDNASNDLVIGARVRNAAQIAGVSPGGAGAVNTLLGYTGSDPKLLQLMGRVQGLSTDAQVRQAAEKLRPDLSSARIQTTRTIGDRVASLVGKRLETTRVAGSGMTGVATGETPANRAVWLQGFGFYGNQDPDDTGAGAYSVSTGGFAFGADTQVGSGDQWRVGGALSFAVSSVTGEDLDTGNSSSINSYLATAYASYTAPKWYLNGALTVGLQQFDAQRNVLVGGVNDIANGDYDGWQLMAGIEGGYPLQIAKNVQVVPLASLTYNGLNQDSYTESSSGGAALAVASSDTYSLRSGLGAKGLFNLEGTDFNSIIEVRAVWLHEFGDTAQNTTAGYAAGGATFTTPGSNLTRDMWNLGAGVRFDSVRDRASVLLNYNAEIGSGWLGQSLTLTYRYTF